MNARELFQVVEMRFDDPLALRRLADDVVRADLSVRDRNELLSRIVQYLIDLRRVDQGRPA